MSSPDRKTSSVVAGVVTDEDNEDELNRLDITDILTDCVENRLDFKESFLCNEDTFDLHDAMAASQLMDPKMDCCEIPASLFAPWKSITTTSTVSPHEDHDGVDDETNTTRMVFPRPIPSNLDDPMTPIPWRTLTVTDAAFIALEILVRLQSLLSGAAVGESTFTCLYAHSAVLADMKSRLVGTSDATNAESLADQFERLSVKQGKEACTENATAQWGVFASALALVEITEVVRGIIINADIYEEEDFSANTHNIIFFTTENTTTINGNKNERKQGKKSDKDLLDTAQVVRLALQKIQSYRQQQEKQKADDDVVVAGASIVELVLKFEVDFLNVSSSLASLSHASLSRTVIQAQMLSRQSLKALESLQSNMDKLLLGGKDDSGSPEDYSPKVQSLLHQTFDSFVNRPLVGNLPIRKISFQRPHKAISILITITSEIDSCVCNLLLRGSTLGRIQRMLDHINQADINILSRSLIVLNLYFDELLLGQYPLQQLLNDHLQQWQTPSPDRNKSLAWIVSEHARAFLNRLAKPTYDCLKLRILNRNRQRTYIDVVMLPEWISLQNEAQLVDLHCHQEHVNTTGASSAPGSNDSPPPTYFTRYVLSILVRLMDRYIESGIEVGLVHNSHHDLSFSFWYRDFLLSALSQNLSFMRQTKEAAASLGVPQQASATATTTHKAKGKKKNRNKVGANGKQQYGKADAPPPPQSAEDLEDMLELRVIAVKRNMCRKSIQFLAALSQAGILKVQRFEFTTLERIFEKRFEVFAEIRQPPPLSYAHYLEGNDFSRVPPGDLIQTVAEGFQYCRTMIDQILQETTSGPKKIDPMYASATESELRALIKVCIGNSVYIQKLRQLVESGEESTAKATFDFESHNQFCIFKLTS